MHHVHIQFYAKLTGNRLVLKHIASKHRHGEIQPEYLFKTCRLIGQNICITISLGRSFSISLLYAVPFRESKFSSLPFRCWLCCSSQCCLVKLLLHSYISLGAVLPLQFLPSHPTMGQLRQLVEHRKLSLRV